MGPWISQTTDYELGRHQKSLEQSLNTAGVNYIEVAVIFKEWFHMQFYPSFASGVLQWDETGLEWQGQ